MKPKLLFTERAMPLILEAFGMTIGPDGLILDANGKEVLAKDGNHILASEFGGMINGEILRDDECTRRRILLNL
jgi:hypothetical protein